MNKLVRASGLLETLRHSFHELRHAFEDRMLAAGIGDRIRRDLFGRRLDRDFLDRGHDGRHPFRFIVSVEKGVDLSDQR